ncbi:MAG: UbiA family prenyltransferase, partial [Syntrophobacteraceae bacterium]
CLMLRVSYLRTVVSGAVKTAGAMAAVLAVVPDPSWLFMVSLFLCLFCWEVGGQNVPNDWSDMDEDARLDAETIPVRFGPGRSAKLILIALAAAVALSVLLYWATPARLSPFYIPAALAAGVFLLFVPAFRLYRNRLPRNASMLFNRASYYPLTLFVIVLLSSML